MAVVYAEVIYVQDRWGIIGELLEVFCEAYIEESLEFRMHFQDILIKVPGVCISRIKFCYSCYYFEQVPRATLFFFYRKLNKSSGDMLFKKTTFMTNSFSWTTPWYVLTVLFAAWILQKTSEDIREVLLKRFLKDFN